MPCRLSGCSKTKATAEPTWHDPAWRPCATSLPKGRSKRRWLTHRTGLLEEEFSRCGVTLIFLKSPAGETPEDQLLVQFQGMIAEYERAQIAERSRRGKRHKARQGVVSVLSGAPYGYRYVKSSDSSEAYYEVIEAEAQVVRLVFELYTQHRLSINAIARLLNERQIATRTGKTRWERSTVWGMLRNPAYRGTAC